MKVIVTGADGFVGRHVLDVLLAKGHEVVASHHVAAGAPPRWAASAPWSGARWLPLELGSVESVSALVTRPCDAVVHLAALASGSAARRDPGLAWEVNAAGTARLLDVVARGSAAGTADPLMLIVSSSEVYGITPPRPSREDDPVAPVSPYAASKLGAEEATREVARRTGLRCIIARPFSHTGPGQATDFVVPALIQRLREAGARGDPTVRTGSLEPRRDYLDVRDVAEAYAALLVRGMPGEIYNIGSGTAISLHELFGRLAVLLGVHAAPALDPALMRAGDIPYLAGNAAKLAAATGWAPRIPLEQTLRDMTNAETH
jgi:GDP-4-dehydro-6-deoxy-D-mannose reductase